MLSDEKYMIEVREVSRERSEQRCINPQCTHRSADYITTLTAF
jgi:hypothetical protein